VNLMLGNLRPQEEVTVNLEVIAGVEVRDSSTRFRFPFTLAPSYHPQAQAARLEPASGEIELPEDQFGDVVLPIFAAKADGLHQVGFDLAVQASNDISAVASPSHAIQFSQNEDGNARVSLATEGDVPNRDLVLDIQTKQDDLPVVSGVDREGIGRVAMVIPSSRFGERSEVPRRVVFVLDRSGSMIGAALKQARKAIEACLGALSAEDQFGLVAFDNNLEIFGRPETPEPVRGRFRRLFSNSAESQSTPSQGNEAVRGSLVLATMKQRALAKTSLGGIGARGGTEMSQALLAAIALLGDTDGDIFLLTDGQVFGTEDILQKIQSKGIRIHCLGIGSASQDRFLALLARGTGGMSRFLTPNERVDLPAVDLFASVGRPLATDLAVNMEKPAQGSIAPQPSSAVFQGFPLVIFGQCSPAGAGQLSLNWKESEVPRQMTVGFDVSGSYGDTLRLIQGARLITDLESKYPDGITPWGQAKQSTASAERRRTKRIRKTLEALSEQYGLASRTTALVAIAERAADQSGEVPETRVVPVGLPRDTKLSAYFDVVRASRRLDARSPGRLRTMDGSADAVYDSAPETSGAFLEDFVVLGSRTQADVVDRETPADEMTLVDRAGQIQPDGGMPGDTDDERVLASVLALLCFLADGHTSDQGVFRSHVRRLSAYLVQAADQNETVKQVLALASEGRPLPGEWTEKSPEPEIWNEIAEALKRLGEVTTRA